MRHVATQQSQICHAERARRLLALVRDDEVCRRLMTTPGVGPVVALTYRATVDVPRGLGWAAIAIVLCCRPRPLSRTHRRGLAESRFNSASPCRRRQSRC